MIAILRISIPTVFLFPATAPRQPDSRDSDEAGCLDEPFQRDFRPRADMADDLGSAQAADTAAGGEGQAAGQAEQEACGVKVARPGGIDDPGYRRCGDGVLLAIGQDDAAALAPGQRGDRDMAAHRLRRCGEVVSLVQRADLRLVGEQDIDLALDQFAERGAMPPDTERVGEAQRDPAYGAWSGSRGLTTI